MGYSFTLLFELPTPAPAEDALLAALAIADCTDSLVGLGTPGRLGLAFTREGRSKADVIAEAVATVQSAIPGIALIAPSLC